MRVLSWRMDWRDSQYLVSTHGIAMRMIDYCKVVSLNVQDFALFWWQSTCNRLFSSVPFQNDDYNSFDTWPKKKGKNSYQNMEAHIRGPVAHPSLDLLLLFCSSKCKERKGAHRNVPVYFFDKIFFFWVSFFRLAIGMPKKWQKKKSNRHASPLQKNSGIILVIMKSKTCPIPEEFHLKSKSNTRAIITRHPQAMDYWWTIYLRVPYTIKWCRMGKLVA